MVRPHKAGLEYFPLDVDMDQDGAVQYIEARHGLDGFAIVVKLMMRVYREGYFIAWSDRERYVFARHVGADAATVEAVVEDCVTEGLFDREIFEAHGVLTSRGIQRRYMEATRRRAGVRVYREYVVDMDTASDYPHVTLVSVNNNGVSDDMMYAESTQRKGKESKGKKKETREAEESDVQSPPIPPSSLLLPECFRTEKVTTPPYGRGTLQEVLFRAATTRWGLMGHSEICGFASAVCDGCRDGCDGEDLDQRHLCYEVVLKAIEDKRMTGSFHPHRGLFRKLVLPIEKGGDRGRA